MNTWMNNPQYLAQVGHALGGLSVMLLATLGSLLWAHGSVRPLDVTIAVGLLAAAVKEFWYDLRYELPKQTLGDSAMDWGFYALGGVLGQMTGTYALAHIALVQ